MGSEGIDFLVDSLGLRDIKVLLKIFIHCDILSLFFALIIEIIIINIHIPNINLNTVVEYYINTIKINLPFFSISTPIIVLVIIGAVIFSVIFSRSNIWCMINFRGVNKFYEKIEFGVNDCESLNNIWPLYINICDIYERKPLSDFYEDSTNKLPFFSRIDLIRKSKPSIKTSIIVLLISSKRYNDALYYIYILIERKYSKKLNILNNCIRKSAKTQVLFGKKTQYYNLVLTISRYVTRYQLSKHHDPQILGYLNSISFGTKNSDNTFGKILVSCHLDGEGERTTVSLLNLIAIVRNSKIEDQIISFINNLDDNDGDLGWLYRRIVEILLVVLLCPQNKKSSQSAEKIDLIQQREVVLNKLKTDLTTFLPSIAALNYEDNEHMKEYFRDEYIMPIYMDYPITICLN